MIVISSAGVKDLTKGSCKTAIIGFAFPIFLSQLFQQLYNTADSLIVGNFCGKESLAAVSSSGNLIFLFNSFFIGLAVGAGVVISRYYGSGDEDRVSKAIHTNVLLSIIAGLFTGFIGVVFSPYILTAMGTAPNVLPESITYFQWYFVGAPAMTMYNILKGIMNALGDTKRPLWYLIISSVLNVILDLILVKPFGVAGAAIASTISQTLSVVLCLIHLMKKGNIYTISLKKLGFDKEMLSETLKYGVPSGIQNSVIGFANVLVQTNINSFGDNAMAACGSYAKIEGFAFMPITSFSMSLTTFIGQNLGAGEKGRAKEGARFGIIAGVILAEIIGVLTFLFGRFLVGCFNSDPAVLEIGSLQCRTEALFYCLLSFSHCVAGVCRGAGKSFVPMFVMLSVWCIFRIIYITVAMQIRHTIILLFLAYPITWTISSVIFYVYLKKSDWVNGFDRGAKNI